MAYGKELGEWVAKQHCSSDTMEPKSLVYKDRIEIMNGLDTDDEGYWLKENLTLIEPSNYTDNLYKGVPKVYVNKAVLSYPNYREVIEMAIEKALPVKGDVTILKDGTLFVNKKSIISLEFIALVALLLIAVLFS